MRRREQANALIDLGYSRDGISNEKRRSRQLAIATEKPTNED